MLDVAEVIFQTCKTYLIQQGKFLLMLFVLIAIAISYYLIGFGHEDKHELTDRTIQELRHEGVPANVLGELATLESKDPIDPKDLAKLQGKVSAEDYMRLKGQGRKEAVSKE